MLITIVKFVFIGPLIHRGCNVDHSLIRYISTTRPRDIPWKRSGLDFCTGNQQLLMHSHQAKTELASHGAKAYFTRG
jgi:hypothetical protein